MTQRTILAAAVCATIVVISAPATAQTPGTWTLYPAQATTFATEVQAPIAPNGSTVVQGNQVPIKFHLFSAPGPVVFESILSDASTQNDFSFLSFRPSVPLTFANLTSLKASYVYLMGNCGGGALRWSVRLDVGNDGLPGNDGSVFIYYGALPNFTDCTTNNQSAVNMIGQPDLRYDTTQLPGGTFYDSYANALTAYGTLPVRSATLVVDTGWFSGDDKLSISSVMANDNSFVPLSGPLTRTCNLPPAAIKITKLSPTMSTSPESVQPPASDTHFRIVDCMYIYNLSISSLLGPGLYKVEAVIGGNPAAGPAVFSVP